MPMTFCWPLVLRHSHYSPLRYGLHLPLLQMQARVGARRPEAPDIMTYLDHVNQNNRIIILQIHSVLRTDNTSDSLDDRVSVEFVIPPHRRADGILQKASQPWDLVRPIAGRA